MKEIKLSDLPFSPTSRNLDIVKQVLIDKGELPNFGGLSLAVFKPGQTDPKHQHIDSYEVLFVVSGSGKIVVAEGEVELRNGICVVINPGELHELANNSDSGDLILLCFGIKI